MFTFGFSTDENETKGETVKSENREISWKESREIKLNELENLEQFMEECSTESIQIEDKNIRYISSVDVVLKLIQDSNDDESDVILKAEENHSDLLVGIYEGGLKIWECTYDILNFIERENLNFDNKKVLDLGCGAGIIGLLCILNGARCYFQDYNEEVIKHVTIPNVAINSETESLGRFRYFSGDWSSFAGLLQNEMSEEEDKFDYIITCETIYNPDNYNKLHDVFKRLLKKEGIIYLGAKSYYFGVGGGLSEFKDFLKKEKVFSFKSIWKYSDGLGREILEIKYDK